MCGAVLSTSEFDHVGDHRAESVRHEDPDQSTSGDHQVCVGAPHVAESPD